MSRNVVAVRLPQVAADRRGVRCRPLYARRGQRRRQVQVRPDRHADEYDRHGDGRIECGSRQVVRDGPKQSARGLHTEWGATMSVPMPSSENYGLDASMRGFRPERHGGAPSDGISCRSQPPQSPAFSRRSVVLGTSRNRYIDQCSAGLRTSCSRSSGVRVPDAQPGGAPHATRAVLRRQTEPGSRTVRFRTRSRSSQYSSNRPPMSMVPSSGCSTSSQH